MVARQPRLEKFRKPEQAHFEDFGVFPRKALVVIHFDNSARKAITAEKDYHSIVAHINRLKEEFRKPALVIGVHQIREQARSGRYDLLGPEDFTGNRLQQLVPQGIEIADHEEGFAARSEPVPFYRRAPTYPPGYLELIENRIIPHLKERNVGSVLLSGAQLHACLWRFAELAVKNGIAAEIDAGASVVGRRVPTQNPRRAREAISNIVGAVGPLGLFASVRPEYIEMLRKGVVDEYFFQGEPGKRFKFSVTPEGHFKVLSISPTMATREVVYTRAKDGRMVILSSR